MADPICKYPIIRFFLHDINLVTGRQIIWKREKRSGTKKATSSFAKDSTPTEAKEIAYSGKLQFHASC